MSENNDPFAAPAGLVPAKSGGEWDTPSSGKGSERPDVETLEDSAWSQDPDAIDREKAVDFADEDEEVVEGGDNPDAPATEDESVEEEVSEEDILSTEQAEEDLPVTPRANERIRQVIEERNAERQRALLLEQRLESMLALQERQTKMQEKLFQEEMSRREMVASQEKNKQFYEQLKQYGYDETELSHVLSVQALEAARKAEERLREFETNREKESREASYRAYDEGLRQELRKAVSDPTTGNLIVDKETAETLYRAAYALARDEQIPNPSQAVKRVVAPIISELRKTKATKRPAPSDTTHKVISTQGKAAGKSPGQRASGKKPLAKDVLAFLK